MKECPQCSSSEYTKSGIINNRQRYRCKACGYHFTVQKRGKGVQDYYVTKALQLYVEGVSYREIERILGVSHVSVINWVRKYGIKRPERTNYHPTYKILSHEELQNLMSDRSQLSGAGMIITELGDKLMLIKWERFREE